MRKLLVAVGVLVLAGAPALAQQDPPLTYPFVSFFDWTDNPQCDAFGRRVGDPSEPCGTNPGQYNFEEGMVGAARRAAHAYPDHYLDPDNDASDLAGEGQVAYDALLHNRPRAPYSHPTDAGHPAYMPDWNHNGRFGEVYGGRKRLVVFGVGRPPPLE